VLPSRWPYAHNFVLEILLTFGKALGGLFLIWMLVQFIKVIMYHKDENGLLTIAFGSFALCRLMFSSTFWQEPYFWAFLAMLVNCSLQRRRARKYSQDNVPDADENQQ
jgi:O-antigen ligase